MRELEREYFKRQLIELVLRFVAGGLNDIGDFRGMLANESAQPRCEI